jgi:hypothetical protein
MSNEAIFATTTLVLTPGLLQDFGGIQNRKRITGDPWSRAVELYNDSKKKNFELVIRSKTVDKFEKRWTRGVTSYAQTYDQILRCFSDALGPSAFKLAYQRAMASSHSEMKHVLFAVQDISEAYRLHFSHSINVATHHDQIFAMSDPAILYNLESRLRASNYGVTLLFLMLSGNIPGPLWVVFKSRELIEQALSQIDDTFKPPDESIKVGGSLRIRTGDLTFFDKKPGN